MMEYFDVVIVGGGPGGLAAAKGASENGAEKVLLLERENETGGVLNQCIHDGFGLHRYKKQLSGPEYASRALKEADSAGCKITTGAIVTMVTRNHEVTYVSTSGIKTVKAGAVVLATGCRERTRGAICIPGYRPAGVYTAGVAQNLVNTKNIMIGKRILILGSGDIGLIMARRLTLEGAEVVAVVEIQDTPCGLMRNISQCLNDFNIPLLLSHTVTKIIGKERLSAVEISKVDKNKNPIKGTEEVIDVDTLILSVGLIPENELARKVGIELSLNGGVKTDDFLETSVPGIFAAGNSRKVMDLADYVSQQGEIAGRNAASFALGVEPAKWVDGVSDDARKGLPPDDCIICPMCPNGCQIYEDKNNVPVGHRCKKGEAFFKQEVISPERILTTTIRINNGEIPLLPVRSTTMVRRSEMKRIIRELSEIVINAPVHEGSIVIEGIGENGVSFIAERNIAIKQ